MPRYLFPGPAVHGLPLPRSLHGALDTPARRAQQYHSLVVIPSESSSEEPKACEAHLAEFSEEIICSGWIACQQHMPAPKDLTLSRSQGRLRTTSGSCHPACEKRDPGCCHMSRPSIGRHRWRTGVGAIHQTRSEAPSVRTVPSWNRRQERCAPMELDASVGATIATTGCHLRRPERGADSSATTFRIPIWTTGSCVRRFMEMWWNVQDVAPAGSNAC